MRHCFWLLLKKCGEKMLGRFIGSRDSWFYVRNALEDVNKPFKVVGYTHNDSLILIKRTTLKGEGGAEIELVKDMLRTGTILNERLAKDILNTRKTDSGTGLVEYWWLEMKDVELIESQIYTNEELKFVLNLKEEL